MIFKAAERARQHMASHVFATVIGFGIGVGGTALYFANISEVSTKDKPSTKVKGTNESEPRWLNRRMTQGDVTYGYHATTLLSAEKIKRDGPTKEGLWVTVSDHPDANQHSAQESHCNMYYARLAAVRNVPTAVPMIIYGLKGENAKTREEAIKSMTPACLKIPLPDEFVSQKVRSQAELIALGRKHPAIDEVLEDQEGNPFQVYQKESPTRSVSTNAIDPFTFRVKAGAIDWSRCIIVEPQDLYSQEDQPSNEQDEP